MPRLDATIYDPAFLGRSRSCHRAMPVGDTMMLVGAGMIDKSGQTADATEHTSPFWSSVVILHGRGHYSDSTGIIRDLRPGMVLHRFPDRVHTTTIDPDSNWREVFLVPGAQVLATMEAFDLIRRDQPVQLAEPDRPWVAWLLNTIERIGHADESHLPAIALDLGRALAELLSSSAHGDASFRHRACRELTRDPTARESLTVVAARLSLSEDSFRKRFRTACGISPGHYRIQQRIDRAVTLLQSGNRTVTQVAEMLGYPSPFAFSTQFTRLTGCPPSALLGRKASASLTTAR